MTNSDAAMMERSSPVERWEQRTEIPLAVLAGMFLVAYALPILDQQVPDALREVCRVVNYVVWVAFAVDYAVRLRLAMSWSYFGRHLPDLAMVVLPALRPLRLLRLLLLLRVLNRRAAHGLHGKVIAYVIGSAVILIFCASLAILDAERGHPRANITGFGDAVWWAMTTVSTVGYGDVYPVTTTGRFIASGLMVGGVALIGVVTATFASFLIDAVREATEDDQAATRADLRALEQQLCDMRAEAHEPHKKLIDLHRLGLLTDTELDVATARIGQA